LKKIGDLFQEADWKTEKHVPFIDCADYFEADELFKITVAIGKEIAHPNTTEHHISWISLFFLPEGEKFPYQIARYEFAAHGSSVQGSNTSSVYTHHAATGWMRTNKGGILLAFSLCNIHGLWQSSKEVKIR
jgi:superoxide reductase